MKLIDRFIEFVTSHYLFTIIITILLTVALGSFALFPKQNNNIEDFFFKDDPFYIQYKHFQKALGSDDIAMVAFQEENFFTNDNIQLIRDLTGALKRIYGIRRVQSLTEIDELLVEDEEIHMQKLIPEGYLSDAKLKEIKDKLTDLKGYNNLATVNKGGISTIIVVEFEPLNEEEKSEACNEIIKITTNIANNKTKLYHTGIPLILNEMNNLTKRDLNLLPPIVGLAILMVIFMLFRNYTLTILAMFTLGMTMGWGEGLYFLIGEKFNYFTLTLPAIIMTLSIADSIHLITHFKESLTDNFENYVENVVSATKAVWKPCLFTTLTTSVGFLSFTTSSLRPIYMLGIFSAIGIVFALIIDVTYLPASLIFMRERVIKGLMKRREKELNKKSGTYSLTVLTRKIGEFSIKYAGGLIVAFILIFSLSIWGITKLQFETNPLKQMSDSNKIKSDLIFLEENFGGVTPVLIVVKSKGENDFTYPEAIKVIDTIQNGIEDELSGIVSGTFSVVDYLKEMDKAFNPKKDISYQIPDKQIDIKDYYDLNPMPEVLKRLISKNRKEVYITLLCIANSTSFEEAEEIKADESAKDFLKNLLGNEYSYAYVGITELILQMEKKLRESLIMSLILTLFLVYMMMLFICKNVKLSIISMVPNMFPIISTLGLMGWLGICMNEGTIMVASITLGIAVDDTIHFIIWYKRCSKNDSSIKQALMETFRIVGKPIIITTIILSLSFCSLLFGSFKPTQSFGMLTAFSMVSAILGDFFLLPGLLLFFKPLKKKGEENEDIEELIKLRVYNENI